MEKRNKLLGETHRVKDEKNFSAFTPESEQVLVAELRLMGYLHENNMWGRVNDAWVTGLLPVGALIHIVPRKARCFVLKTHAAAALTWPAEEIAPRVWRKKAWHRGFGVAHHFQRQGCGGVCNSVLVPAAFATGGPLSKASRFLF